MKMCEAFQNAGADVVFLYPRRQNNFKENIFSFYGVKKIFKVKKLFSLDLLRLKFLGSFPYIISAASFYFSVFFYVLFNLRGYKYVLTRDFYGAAVFKLFGKKVIFDVHSFPARPGFSFKFFLKLNDKFIVITEGLKKELVNFNIVAEKIFVLPDGVDLEKFNVKLNKEEVRKKLGLPQDKKLVMYTGHLYEWKGANMLLEVASNFQFPRLPSPEGEANGGRAISNFQTNSKFQNSNYEKENIASILFIFVGGTDKDIERFKEKVKKENLNNVLVAGRKPYNEIPLWLKAADVLVLPNSGREKLSALYTSPLKMFEYMAVGKPIVASALPSIQEILNEQNAVLVEPDNPQALTQGIKKVLEDEALAEKITARAQKDAQEFSWGKRAKKVIKIFEMLKI